MNNSIDRNTSVWLDAIRAFSAQAVVLGHLHQNFFSGRDDTTSLWYHFAWALENRLSAVSHQAVIAFFVMSGYLVGGRVVQQMVDGSFSVRRYFSDRLIRLWVVLLPAIILTGLLDCFGLRFGHGWEVIHHRAFFPEWYLADAWSFARAIANALFLQMFVGYQYGTNVSLWSVSNEFWYYVLFPCFFMVIFGFRKTGLAAGGLAVLIVIMFALADTRFSATRSDMLYAYFGIWSLSAFARLLIGRLRLCIGFVLIALAVGSGWQNGWQIDPTLRGDWDVASLVAGFILVSGALPGARFSSLTSFFASYSYSLYAVHLPVLICAMSFDEVLREKVPFSAETGLRFLGYFLFANIVALLFWFVTERNTALMRRWLRGCALRRELTSLVRRPSA